jgi:outer membrane lipoprotein SlyB
MQTARTPLVHVTRGRRTCFALALVPLALAAGCQGLSRAENGAILGGTGGAVAGNMIAKAAGGSRTAGTVLGGLAGTVGGAIVGNNMDRAEARADAAEAALAESQRPPALSLGEVVEMSRRGTDDRVIMNHIRGSGQVYRLTTDDILYLQDSRVSPAVIAEMQRTANPGPRAVVAPPPVVVAPAPPPVYVVEPVRPVGFGIEYHHYRRCR